MELIMLSFSKISPLFDFIRVKIKALVRSRVTYSVGDEELNPWHALPLRNFSIIESIKGGEGREGVENTGM